MYCDGRCQYLNERKHKCELTGEKLTYMKQTGSISFFVHEHRDFPGLWNYVLFGTTVRE